MSLRRCVKCEEALPFARYVTKAGNLVDTCQWCRSAAARKNNLRARYGLSEEQYLGLLRAQEGRCAICQRKASEMKKPLVVDHCHTTGEIRGLICDSENTSLGKFEDDPARLRAAADYLEKSHTGLFIPNSPLPLTTNVEVHSPDGLDQVERTGE